MFDLNEHPHRRYNPLTGEWVLVSPHRTQRPWLGLVEESSPESIPAYDPNCYLCPGNSRAGAARNPHYDTTFVFENDFAALHLHTPEGTQDENNLLMACSEPGVCRVVCFSPRHDLTLSRMPVADIERVVHLWAEEYQALGSLSLINYVQIFENRGELMGASNPHPHCQIWANQHLPNEPVKEQTAMEHYSNLRHGCLLCDYQQLEERRQLRLVVENRDFVALVPFWAVWPFETMILSRRHVTALDELSGQEISSLADILKRMITRYDNLFQMPFPYSMGFHQRPTDNSAHPEWHLHAHFYPPLLRSATVRKFMVGYEMLGTPQRDITAESAAERLRALSEVHYADARK